MQRRPTHSAITQFVSSILPPKTNDVQLLYHVPRNPKYNADTARVDQVVLSVTPTPGVYDLIAFEPAAPAASVPRPPRTICFLHRPFQLERRRVRRGTLVLASHTSFDENLTVGWNVALAARLGMNVDDSLCVQGYKGDADRKIGIIGKAEMSLGVLQKRIEQEFGNIEFAQDGVSDQIHVVAIMNAFHADEVHRVLEAAEQRGWVPAGERVGRNVLYLTGQPRESGLLAAKETGMSVICVGHAAAEEWGIRNMAVRIKTAFPGLQVKGVHEEEILMPRKN